MNERFIAGKHTRNYIQKKLIDSRRAGKEDAVRTKCASNQLNT